MSNEIDEAVKRVRELGATTPDDTPAWLEYGAVCYHDENILCEHRFEYLLETIQGLKPEFKHIKYPWPDKVNKD